MSQKSVFLPLILLVYGALAALYLAAVPIFESPDELQHFGVIQHIANTGQLPVQGGTADDIGLWLQQGSQPPLYYLLAAALVAPIDRSDYAAVTRINPHANVGVPNLPGNKNQVLHEYPLRLQGTTLAVYVARAFSLLLGGVTVCAVYQSAHTLAPDTPRIAQTAAALTAFNPQFLFISVSANNDNLVTALASLAIWQILCLLRAGFSVRRSLSIGLLCALAAISKLSGLVLLPLAALAALVVGWRRRDRRGLLFFGASLAALWLLLAGWWYARNLILYDEFFGTNRMLLIFGRRSFESFGTWAGALWGEMSGLRWSYWGVFGWFNIVAPPLFYIFTDLLALAGVLGLLAYGWRARRESPQRSMLALLLLAFAFGFVSLLHWTTQTAASQGRLLFPYSAAISTLAACGLSVFRVRHFDAPRWALAGLALWALALPFVTIAPQYTPPPQVSAPPQNAVPLDVSYSDVRLLAYAAPDARYAPGDTLALTLYWQPLAQSPLDYSLSLRAISADGTLLGSLDTYPGWGMLRTSAWRPGTIYADTYHLSLSPDARATSALYLIVSWWQYPNGARLPAVQNGAATDTVRLPVGAFADTLPPLPTDLVETPPVTFGDSFRLLAYHLAESRLTLAWETLRPPPEDLTVFAQVLDGATIVGQGDAPPALPTRYLRAGERFISRHTLVITRSVTPGRYPLVIGWYSTRAPLRLPTDAPDNAYRVATLILP
ncbi:MAG: hypothetical protein HXY40_13905 [Chloroflexi bacterium]|nr:hypothetical protein [Chloroflexota bacterium]